MVAHAWNPRPQQQDCEFKGGIYSETLSQERGGKMGHEMKRNLSIDYGRKKVKEAREH